MRFRWLPLLLLALPSVARAQGVRGVVVEEGANAAVPGVVVLLLDATGTPVARALTNERGEYRVTALQPGAYRIRTLRIGFTPVTSDVIQLAAGEDVTRQLRLAGVRVMLDTVRVVDKGACQVARDSAAATFRVWEQARAALTATQLTASRGISATVVVYERALDRSFRRVLAQQSFVQSGYVRQPWLAASPDMLHSVGYVSSDGDSITYRAPGLEVLLSRQFVEDHCFRLAASKDASLIGVAFEPTRDRRRIPEIRGTMWLDRNSSELRRLDYNYVNVPRTQAQHAGGEMEFIRMRDGSWAIARWNIRMPLVGRQVDRVHAVTVGVIGLSVTGGELALAVRGADTLWSRPPLRLVGTVSDSATGAPVGGARVGLEGTNLEDISDAQGRFTISGVLPGEYTVAARSPALDSLGAVVQADVTVADSTARLDIKLPSPRELAASLCRTPTMAGALSREGVVLGRIEVRGDSLPPAGARVIAEWADSARKMTIKHEVIASERGTYRMCGVPLNNTLFIRAVTEDGLASVSQVLIPPQQRFARADLVVDRASPASASFGGLVLIDSTTEPIAGAEVLLPALGKSVMTNQRGEFRLNDVPVGTHDVSVRRVGYGPLSTRLSFAPNETVDRRIFLSKVVALEAVEVNESAVIPSFEENKRLGLGEFLTRAELAQKEGQLLSTVLRQFTGIKLVAWDFKFPNKLAVAGSRAGCFAQVYLDRTLMFSGQRDSGEEPFDIHSISPDRIEAIEFYRSPAETPLEYSKLNSQCGVLVIHTRR